MSALHPTEQDLIDNYWMGRKDVLAELRKRVEQEQPCSCNPAYGRVLGPDGAHALECVGKTSLRNGVLRLIEETRG